MIDLLNERVKGVNKTNATSSTRRSCVVAKPYQHELVSAEIESSRRIIRSATKTRSSPTRRQKRSARWFDQVKDDFAKQYGSIKILQDSANNSFAVWAMPSQHEALKKLLDELGSLESSEKETATLYTPKHVDAATLLSVLKDLQPSLKVTHDTVNARLILRGSAEELEEAKGTLAAIDTRDDDAVVRTFRSYPIKGFYSYDGVGAYRLYYVRDMGKLSPPRCCYLRLL